MNLKNLGRHAAVVGAYTALTFYFCRPVGLHLFDRLLGPGGDASVTLWNIWHFRHSLMTLHSNPLWTDFLYWPSGGNLLMHQYTLFCDLVALPLVPKLGLVGAYNLHMIASLVLNGYCLYLMAKDFGISAGSAFAAGAMLAFSPFIGFIIDSGDGVCYQILWPVILFFWMFLRAVRENRLLYAGLAAVALSIEWAYSYYYFLFCVLAVPLTYLWLERPVTVELTRRPSLPRPLTVVLNALCVAAGLGALAALRRGQVEFHGHGSFRVLAAYVAPYVGFWALLVAWAGMHWKAKVYLNPRIREWWALKPYAATLGAWALLNLPLAATIVWSMASGDYGTTPSSWRGGGNPTDPLELILPGTAHPLWGGALAHLYALVHIPPAGTSWLGLVPLAAIGWLWKHRQEHESDFFRYWFAAFAFCFIFTLGPWFKLYGVHTYLPLPFYAVHLLPVFSNIQHGMRFVAFTALFLAMLFGVALDRMRIVAAPRYRRWIVPAALGLLALEYAPPRRQLWAFKVPPIVERLAARADGPMLTVPVGANFNGISGEGWRGHMMLDLALQSVHHKPIVGGYLARVSARTYRTFIGNPFLTGLMTAQDGGTLPPGVSDPDRAGKSLIDLGVRWVMIDRSRIPASLTKTIASWPLHRVDAEDSFVLYEMRLR